MSKENILQSVLSQLDGPESETPELLRFLAGVIDQFDCQMVVVIRDFGRRLTIIQPPRRRWNQIIALIKMSSALLKHFFQRGIECQECCIEGFRLALSMIQEPELRRAQLLAMTNLADALRETEAGDHHTNLQEAYRLGRELLSESQNLSNEILPTILFNHGLCSIELGRLETPDYFEEAMHDLALAKSIWTSLGLQEKVIKATLVWCEAALNSKHHTLPSLLDEIKSELDGLKTNPSMSDYWEDYAKMLFNLNAANCRIGREGVDVATLSDAIERLDSERHPQLIIHLCAIVCNILGVFHDKGQPLETRLRVLQRAESALASLISHAAEFTEIERLMSDHSQLYQDLVLCCLELNQPSLAWQYAERSKTRALTKRVIGFDALERFMSRQQCHVLQFYLASYYFVIFKAAPGMTEPLVIRHDNNKLEQLFQIVRQYLWIYEKGSILEYGHEEWKSQQPTLLRKICDLLDLNEIVPDKEEGFKSIAIIPHRILHMIPFAALRVRGTFLSDYCPAGLRIALNSTSLTEEATPALPCQDRARFEKLFLINNPNNDLLFSPLEIEGIKPWFDRVIELKNAEASLEKVLASHEELKSSSFAHFSCHGRHDSADPLRSYLELADHRQLAINALLSQSIDFSECFHVCLSAFETGVVNINTFSDECIGINFAFLLLGARSVLSTLWRVDEFSAALFMRSYYQALISLSAHQAIDWPSVTSQAVQIGQQRLKTIRREDCLELIREMKVDQSQRNALIHQLQASDELPFNHVYFWAPYFVVNR